MVNDTRKLEPFSVPGVPLNPVTIKNLAKFNDVPISQICCMCGSVIKVMAFKNTGVCCENHRKDRDNDHAPFRGGQLAP